MAASPQLRWTDPETLGFYLSSSGLAPSVANQVVRQLELAAAEEMVENFCRRRFGPDPVLRDDYQMQVVGINGQGQTNVLAVAGQVGFGYQGSQKTYLSLPITAIQLMSALRGIAGLGAVVCSGGPLPMYPIEVYMIGVPTPTVVPQAPIELDSAGILPNAVAISVDMGFDSNAPVARKFTTRGKSDIRLPDLRMVSAAPDPRLPGNAGVVLYGRRLYPNQYTLGYGGYAAGGADEQIGSGDVSEPATNVILGYGYGLGMTLAQQFAYVLPQMYLSNDLWITGRWGWNPIPASIISATYAVAARRIRERDAAFSDQMVTPEGISLAFFKQLPASIQAVLLRYRVMNIALI